MPEVLRRIADLLGPHPRARTGLRVLGFVGLSLLANGYVFGVADHGIHLAFQDMVLHAERWQGDFLLEASRHHHSLMWWLLAPWVEALGAPLAYATVHVACLAATGLALDGLARQIGGSEGAAWRALLVLAPMHFALGGVPTLDPLLLPRTAALPIELFAILAALRGRSTGAFLLLGLAASIHVPSAAGLAAGLAGCCLVLEPRPAAVLLRSLAVLPGALPVLLRWWAAGDAGAALSPVDPHWMALLDLRLTHHLDPTSWPLWHWLLMGGWLGVGWLGLGRCGADDRARRALAALGLCLLAWCLGVGVGLARGLDLALALQLEAWETSRFLTWTAGLILAGWWARAEWRAPRDLLGLLGASLVVLVSWRVTADQHPARFLPSGEATDESRVAEWLAGETPEGSLIAVSPHRFASARHSAQRPLFVTWKDGGEALFDRALALEWERRVRVACGCDLLPERQGVSERPEDGLEGLARLRRRLERAARAAPSGQRVRVLAREGVDYLVLDAVLASEVEGAKLVHREGSLSVLKLERPAQEP